MFDGIQLYKEEFGDSYTYDSKGNVVSIANLAKQNSSFAYNGSNDLVKSVDPKGSEFNYVYDDKHNISKATSAENVVYSFEYDPYGNPKTSEVGDSTNGIIKYTATYTSGDKAEGNYLNTMTDSSGNTITNKWDVDKGLLESVKTSNETDDQATKYAYDINTDNLLSVSKSVGLQTIINKYKYKYENDRIKAIEHNGFSYNFGYDALGSNTKVSVGTQDLISNEYEERSGKLKSSTYGNGQIVSNGYDSSTG
jgi:YD repeat-containing protein